MAKGKYARRAQRKREHARLMETTSLKVRIAQEQARYRAAEIANRELHALTAQLVTMWQGIETSAKEEALLLRVEIEALVIEVGKLSDQQQRVQVKRLAVNSGLEGKDRTRAGLAVLERAASETIGKEVIIGHGVYRKTGMTVGDVQRIQRVRGLR